MVIFNTRTLVSVWLRYANIIYTNDWHFLYMWNSEETKSSRSG